MGLNRSFSTSACKLYGILVFIWINWILKSVVHLYCTVNRECVVEKEIMKR